MGQSKVCADVVFGKFRAVGYAGLDCTVRRAVVIAKRIDRTRRRFGVAAVLFAYETSEAIGGLLAGAVTRTIADAARAPFSCSDNPRAVPAIGSQLL